MTERSSYPLISPTVAITSVFHKLAKLAFGTKTVTASAQHPIFSVIGPGKNGSTTLIQSIHSDRRDLVPIALHESERQRFNRFHLHFIESLTTVLATFPDRPHRIIYPVRRDLARQLVSSFIQYTNKIAIRADRLGLPAGDWDNWSMDDIISAFDCFVELRQLPQSIGAFHRQMMEMFDFEVTSLTGVHSFERSGKMLAVVLTESINDVVPALKTFCAPSKFTLKQFNLTANDRTDVFSVLVPRVQTRLAEPLRALRAEFPGFYDVPGSID